MGSRWERAARPEFGPGSDGPFKISGNSPGGPSPHTTRSFLPILSTHSRTKSSCSSVWVAM